MTALRKFEYELTPLMGDGTVISPLGHSFCSKWGAAHGRNLFGYSTRATQLIEEGSDHKISNARISGTRQQPFWQDVPEVRGDNARMPKKPSDFNEAAGGRLGRCREFLGLTQGEFATDLGVSRSVYENWESGDNCPKPEAVERVRKKHRITHDWVFGGDPYLLPEDMKKAVSRPEPVSAKSQPPARRKRQVA